MFQEACLWTNGLRRRTFPVFAYQRIELHGFLPGDDYIVQNPRFFKVDVLLFGAWLSLH